MERARTRMMDTVAATFQERVAAVMAPPAPLLAPDSPCQEAARLLGAVAGPAVVVDGERRPLGVVSRGDLLRLAAFRLPPDTPVARVMSAPIHCVAAGEPLYRALGEMRRHGLAALPVVDGTGRLAGLLRAEAAATTLAGGLLRVVDALAGPPTAAGLAAIKAAQADAVGDLLARAVPAPAILAMLAAVNDDLYRLAADLVLADLEADGWGPPPVPFATIVMGSGGRGESLLRPDQDNGLVIADYPDADHTAFDRYFWELGHRLTRRLDAVGFPLCNGAVMATNPLWRKTLSQWSAQVDGWIRRRDQVGLLYADIFYDFRAVQGELALGQALRARVSAAARAGGAFLRDLAQNESHHSVGLGWFRRFVTDPEEGPHQGEINLKRNGSLPIVEGVRLFALRLGVEATGTVERIAALTARGVLSSDEADALRGAHAHVVGLMLRRQVAEVMAGRPPSTYLPPEDLSSRDSDLLQQAMRTVAALGQRVKEEFTGAVL